MPAKESERDGLVYTAGNSSTAQSTRTDEQTTTTTHRSSRSDDFWATLSNVLVWYDFSVFGYFGDVIGEVFFPPQSGHAATMESFLIFGGAFVVRPLGGMLLGYIGDVYGPKKALVLSIFLMAFPTFAMGCLPTYKQVGPVAILLLVIARLLQGLSVGGQLMSSLVFTLEGHDPSQWGLYGSYVFAAANFGSLLGALAGSVLDYVLTEEQLMAWGWRIPFWLGILVSLSGFFLSNHGDGGAYGHQVVPPCDNPNIASKNITDSTDDQSDDGDEEVLEEAALSVVIDTTTSTPNPLQHAFRSSNLRPLLAASMVPLLSSSGFYLSFVWMVVYMKDLIAEPVPNAFAVNSMSLLVSVCFFFPVAGMLSDKFGRRRIMVIGGGSLCLFSPFLIMLIGRGNAIWAFVSQCLLGVSFSCWGAPMCAWLVEAFEPTARLTSVAIGYNVAQALAGGLTPFLATYLVDAMGPNAPGGILTAIALVALTGLLVVAPKPSALGNKKCGFEAVTTGVVELTTRESDFFVK